MRWNVCCSGKGRLPNVKLAISLTSCLISVKIYFPHMSPFSLPVSDSGFWQAHLLPSILSNKHFLFFWTSNPHQTCPQRFTRMWVTLQSAKFCSVYSFIFFLLVKLHQSLWLASGTLAFNRHICIDCRFSGRLSQSSCLTVKQYNRYRGHRDRIVSGRQLSASPIYYLIIYFVLASSL